MYQRTGKRNEKVPGLEHSHQDAIKIAKVLGGVFVGVLVLVFWQQIVMGAVAVIAGVVALIALMIYLGSK